MTSTLTELLDRVVVPTSGGFSPEHARFVLTLGFSAEEQARFADLSDRVQDGSLSPDELDELDAMTFANTMLGVMQSRARVSLRQHQQQPAA